MRGKSMVAFGVAAVATGTALMMLARHAAHSASVGRLTADAWGVVKIGMPRAAVEGVLHAALTVDNSASGSDDCYDGWVGSPDHPKPAVSFRFVDGRLAVISLTDASIDTDTGVRIGDPESKVLAAYGSRLDKTPAPYYDEKDPQHQLYLWTASSHGLLFWIDEHGKVERIEAGTEQLKAMEGCA